MTDYSKMSDFEINLQVAITIGGFVDEEILHEEKTIFKHHGNSQYTAFDPCNSWADSGPIIASNRIMLNPYCADELWKAEFPVIDDGFMKTYAVNYDKNPLRAAMIVFLMMQEDK